MTQTGAAALLAIVFPAHLPGQSALSHHAGNSAFTKKNQPIRHEDPLDAASTHTYDDTAAVGRRTTRAELASALSVFTEYTWLPDAPQRKRKRFLVGQGAHVYACARTQMRSNINTSLSLGMQTRKRNEACYTRMGRKGNIALGWKGNA